MFRFQHTTGWLWSTGTGRRAAAGLAEIEGRRFQQRAAEICQKTNAERIRRRGHWTTHELGGRESPTMSTDSCISPILRHFPYKKKALLGLVSHDDRWSGARLSCMHLCQEYIRSGGSIAGQIRQIPLDFLRNIQTWNSATPIFKQVFQLDDAKLLHEKCMFQHFHPFQNCCFGYQELRILKFLEALIKSWDWFVGSFIGIATSDWRAADWKGVDKVSLVVKAKGWLIWVPRATVANQGLLYKL